MTFVIYCVYNCTDSRPLAHSGLGFYYVDNTTVTSDLLRVQSIVHKRSKASSTVCTSDLLCVQSPEREVGGWGRVPFSKKLMSPTPRRKWYLTTGRRAH